MRLSNKAEAVLATMHPATYTLELYTADETLKLQLPKLDYELLESIFRKPDRVASPERFQAIYDQYAPTSITVEQAISQLLEKLRSHHKSLEDFLLSMPSGYMLHHNWEAARTQTSVPEIYHDHLNKAVQTIGRQIGMLASICKQMPQSDKSSHYICDPGALRYDLDFILKIYSVVASLILETIALDPETPAYQEIEIQLNRIRARLNLSAVSQDDLSINLWPHHYIEQTYQMGRKLAYLLKDF